MAKQMVVAVVIGLWVVLVACATAVPKSSTTTPNENGGGQTRENKPQDTESIADYQINADATTNVAKAQSLIYDEGIRFYLVVLSKGATGLEAEIYKDLVERKIRATTGPDEGFNTESLKCNPNCVFVPIKVVDALSVESWASVLRHEHRHMIQASHNPTMADDFRDAEGLFTTYAAFLEACADDGIYVGEEIYHAQVRMPQLNKVLGEAHQADLQAACEGHKDTYDTVVRLYEQETGQPGSFAKLFPQYR